MNDFFEFPVPEPPAQREQRLAQPPWFGAPRGVMPGVVPLELVLARNARVAVAVTLLEAYPTGFGFALIVLTRSEDDELDPMITGPVHRPGRSRAQTREAMLRFGLQFADGARATNTSGREGWQPDQPPAGPVLRGGGGHSSGGEWHQRMWVWPLPPPGTLSFVCEWPAAGVELTHAELDAQLVIDAAARARPMFEADA